MMPGTCPCRQRALINMRGETHRELLLEPVRGGGARAAGRSGGSGERDAEGATYVSTVMAGEQGGLSGAMCARGERTYSPGCGGGGWA